MPEDQEQPAPQPGGVPKDGEIPPAAPFPDPPSSTVPRFPRKTPAASRNKVAEISGEAPLPSAWKDLLEKTPAAPLLWTYAELGQDLQGRGDGERSAGLRELIGKLNLPRGSSAFWPLTLEDSWPHCLEGGVLPPDVAFFLQGLVRLRPRAVVLFGSHSCLLSGLDLSLRLPFTQQVKGGRLFLLLPAWRDLLADGVLREQSVTYLRVAFTSLSALRPR